MKGIADLLSHSETSSRPIAQIKTIFQHLVVLSREVFNDPTGPLTGAGQLQSHWREDMTSHNPTSSPFQLGWSNTDSLILPPELSQAESCFETSPLSMADLSLPFDDPIA